MAWNPITGLFDSWDDLRDRTLRRQMGRQDELNRRADARTADMRRRNLAEEAEWERRTVELTERFAPEVLARMLQQREAEAAIALRAQNNATNNAIRTSRAAGDEQRSNLKTQGDILAGQLGAQRGHELAYTQKAWTGPEAFLPQVISGAKSMQESNQAYGLKLAETLKPTTLQQLTPVLTTAGLLALALA